MTGIPGEKIIRLYELFHCTVGRDTQGSVLVQDENE